MPKIVEIKNKETSKSQYVITIPLRKMQKKGWKAGDVLDDSWNENGDLVLSKVDSEVSK